jgi:hypothetical protein
MYCAVLNRPCHCNAEQGFGAPLLVAGHGFVPPASSRAVQRLQPVDGSTNRGVVCGTVAVDFSQCVTAGDKKSVFPSRISYRGLHAQTEAVVACFRLRSPHGIWRGPGGGDKRSFADRPEAEGLV